MIDFRILPRNIICEKVGEAGICNYVMRLYKHNTSGDGYRWVCTNRPAQSIENATRLHLYELPLRYYFWMLFEGFGKELNASNAFKYLEQSKLRLQSTLWGSYSMNSDHCLIRK